MESISSKSHNNTEQKTKELDDLIALAETVSLKIQTLSNNLSRTLFIIICIVIIDAFSYFFINSMSISSINTIYILGLCVISFFSLLYSILEIRKIQKEINQEYKILNKLHDMITLHKQGFDSELGVVSNAIYEMKLSRIEFNFDNISNNFFTTLSKTITTLFS